MGWQPNYQTEAKAYAQYILKNHPNAKIGVLYQNDDYGKDYLKGFKDGLGGKASMIVREVSYEVTDPTVDSQIVTLKGSGADAFFNITTPKFAAQAIRKAHEIDWKPVHFLNNVSSSIDNVLKPAGLEASKGIISSLYLKDAADPQWHNDQDYKNWLAWMKQYNPGVSTTDAFYVYAYAVSSTLHQVLVQAGNDLTRENVMRQAANLKNIKVPMLLPGIHINTGPNDFAPIEAIQLGRFDGKRYVEFGDVLGQ
jgi:branched-chain amino acid transport system substrate-binding protein